jgi:hypothetical protein
MGLEVADGPKDKVIGILRTHLRLRESVRVLALSVYSVDTSFSRWKATCCVCFGPEHRFSSFEVLSNGIRNARKVFGISVIRIAFRKFTIRRLKWLTQHRAMSQPFKLRRFLQDRTCTGKHKIDRCGINRNAQTKNRNWSMRLPGFRSLMSGGDSFGPGGECMVEDSTAGEV